MANKEAIVKVKLSVNSKEYNQAIRAANQEAKEFKRQQREAFKNAGANEGMNALLATAKKLAPAISAGSAALAVANKAMKENQTFTDEWARITEGARASYESFVDSLVNADFSGFFSNMSDVIQSARDAADAIDALDTTKIFNSKAMAELNLQAAQYRLILRSKTSSEQEKEAARAGLIGVRDSQMAEAQKLSNANLVAFADILVSNIVRKGGSLTRDDILRTDAEGNYMVREDSKYQKYLGYLENYNSWAEKYQAFSQRSAKGVDYQGNEYRRSKDFGVISEAEYQDLKAFMELSDDKLRQAFDYYIAGLSDIQRVIEMKTSDTRYISESAGGGKTSTTAAEGSIAALQNSIREAEGDLNAAADTFGRHAARRIITKLKEDMAFLEMEGKALGAGLSIGMPGVPALNPALVGQHLANIPTLPSVGSVEDLEDNSKASEYATQGLNLLTDTIGRLGLMSNIVEPEVSKFLNVFGSIVSQVGGAIGGPIGGVLSGIGGLLGSFAGGGIVGGTSYKGDNLLQAVNSKEMILNGYQQKNLLSMINAGGGGSQSISYVIKGEDLYVTLSNYKRRARKS